MPSESGLAVHIENLEKQFVVHSRGLNPLRRLMKFLQSTGQGSGGRFHALKNINLKIKKGETVALVGVNGSGKSTLLRIITGVTRPTSGRVAVSGRLGGLVDLGAGFHGDLTGYENIFLHGRILGLSRKQIFQILPAIEEFSELGDFLNTRVGHFSAGMFLRMAFSLAVCSNPEILIVDEALAVGDAYFQWKCLQKIEAMKAKGLTLLFVSHMPEAAAAICERAVWLHEGKIRADGASGDIMQDYNRFLFQGLFEGEPIGKRHEISAFMQFSRFGTGGAAIQNVRFLDGTGHSTKTFNAGEDVSIELEIMCRNHVGPACLYLVLEKPGQSVSYFRSADRGIDFPLHEGTNAVQILLPNLPLRDGVYYATLAVGSATDHELIFDCHQKAYTFVVREGSTVIANRFSARFMNLGARVKTLNP